MDEVKPFDSNHLLENNRLWYRYAPSQSIVTIFEPFFVLKSISLDARMTTHLYQVSEPIPQRPQRSALNWRPYTGLQCLGAHTASRSISRPGQ